MRILHIRQIGEEAIQQELNRHEIDNCLTHIDRNDEEQEETNGNLFAAVAAEDMYKNFGHVFEEGAKHSAEEKKNSSMRHVDDFL
jgi:predicted RNA-binding protein Jag